MAYGKGKARAKRTYSRSRSGSRGSAKRVRRTTARRSSAKSVRRAPAQTIRLELVHKYDAGAGTGGNPALPLGGEEPTPGPRRARISG